MKEQPDETSIRDRFYERVLELMDKDQPFLDSRLTLNKLARIVGTNRTRLSQTLNNQTKLNFSRWLASFRVNHIIRQIELHPDKSLEALYPLSGFSSRTSFFRQFREVTGESPRSYS